MYNIFFVLRTLGHEPNLYKCVTEKGKTTSKCRAGRDVRFELKEKTKNISNKSITTVDGGGGGDNNSCHQAPAHIIRQPIEIIIIIIKLYLEAYVRD